MNKSVYRKHQIGIFNMGTNAWGNRDRSRLFEYASLYKKSSKETRSSEGSGEAPSLTSSCGQRLPEPALQSRPALLFKAWLHGSCTSIGRGSTLWQAARKHSPTSSLCLSTRTGLTGTERGLRKQGISPGHFSVPESLANLQRAYKIKCGTR